MKGVTIMLVGLLLMPGAGTARAAAEDFVSSIAIPAGHAEPLLDEQLGDILLFPDTYLDAGVNGDEDMPAGQSMTVWDYVIDPQVTIDLKYRPLTSEENDFELISDGVDLKQITQNFMLGFHYKF